MLRIVCQELKIEVKSFDVQNILNFLKKLKDEEYGSDMKKLYEDMKLMFENCKTYNKPDSELTKDAESLLKLLEDKYTEVPKQLRSLYDELINLKKTMLKVS